MKAIFSTVILILILNQSCKINHIEYVDDVVIDDKFGFRVLFGNGFQGDTISVAINGVSLFEKQILTSSIERNDIVPNTKIIFDHDTLDIEVNRMRSYLLNFEHAEVATFELVKNGSRSNFSFSLRKGRFFFIEDMGYHDKADTNFSNYKERLRVVQYKKAPALY